MIDAYGVSRQVFRHLTTAGGGQMNVTGRHVLVIGSQKPWVEAVALAAGARHVTTVDYAPLKSEHPKIDAVTPDAFAKRYLDGSLPQFDALISFSSVEHSGLGRYGDALNPWGDLIAMGRAWCALRPGGEALIGVPAGADRIHFNECRVYGKLMFSHLFANWEQVNSGPVVYV